MPPVSHSSTCSTKGEAAIEIATTAFTVAGPGTFIPTYVPNRSARSGLCEIEAIAPFSVAFISSEPIITPYLAIVGAPVSPNHLPNISPISCITKLTLPLKLKFWNFGFDTYPSTNLLTFLYASSKLSPTFLPNFSSLCWNFSKPFPLSSVRPIISFIILFTGSIMPLPKCHTVSLAVSFMVDKSPSKEPESCSSPPAYLFSSVLTIASIAFWEDIPALPISPIADFATPSSFAKMFNGSLRLSATCFKSWRLRVPAEAICVKPTIAFEMPSIPAPVLPAASPKAVKARLACSKLYPAPISCTVMLWRKGNSKGVFAAKSTKSSNAFCPSFAPPI